MNLKKIDTIINILAITTFIIIPFLTKWLLVNIYNDPIWTIKHLLGIETQ